MSDERVPQLLLERLAKGELEGPKKEEVLARLAREPGGMDRLASLEASDRAILAEIPPSRFRADLDRAVGVRSRPRWLTFALPAAAALTAVLALLPMQDSKEPLEPIETTRLKGGDGPTLSVFHGESRMADGDPAQEGDVLSFLVRAPSPLFGALIAVDGAGTVSPIVPATGSMPIRIEPGRPLPSSYELDDAPRFERFFLVTSETPFDVASIVEAFRARRSEAVQEFPSALSVDVFEVKKSP